MAITKKYDIFISHSSKDKRFVKKIAQQLEQRRIKVWFDLWEMKPGDRLRDRIMEGIDNSRYFMVVLSENSLNAPWVKNELDSAMMRELSEKNIIVIPLLYGKIDPADIPLDLKGKLYLDVRKPKNFLGVLDKLADFFQADKRKYQAHLKVIREGLIDSNEPIRELTLLAHRHYPDATVKAAITGLSKHKTSSAMLGIALSILDSGSIGKIKQAIKISGELSDYGGLILLSATLLYDDRFILEKLEIISKVLKRNDELDDIEEILKLQKYNIHKEPRLVAEWAKIIESIKNQDIKEGFVFGSIYKGIWGWQWHFLNRYSSQELSKAKQFVCSTIPKLDLLFERRLGLYDSDTNNKDNSVVHNRWKILPYDLF